MNNDHPPACKSSKWLMRLKNYKITKTSLFAFENEATLMRSASASLQLNSTTKIIPWEPY